MTSALHSILSSNRSSRLLTACLVGDLAAGTLGYAIGGPDGGVIAGIAFALALGAVGGLLLAIGLTVAEPPGRTRVRPAVGGAVAAFGWSVLAVSVLDPSLPLWGLYGGVALVGLAVGIASESATGGLWHGALACGAGGVLTVYPSVYESFTMQPELGAFVLLAAVAAPLVFGVAGGVGGGLGALAFDAIGTRGVSE